MSNESNSVKSEQSSGTQALTCGIIMPISPIDGCSAEHWSEVKQIIQDTVDSISEPRFHAKLVSDADDIGVIQKRIVQGVYNSDVVICDVSAKNSNVMFELGMRLAFDKPTVIIKDDKTDYSFDTGIIEHIPYPRDLRFSKIVGFKKTLAEKLIATHAISKNNPNHSTFLKNFGTFKVAQLNQTEAPGEQLILETLSDLQREMSLLRRQTAKFMSPKYTHESLSPMVSALVELRKKDPTLTLEYSEELVSKFLESYADVAHRYETRTSFAKALTDSCALANLL